MTDQERIKELESLLVEVVGVVKQVDIFKAHFGFSTHFGKEACDSGRCPACMFLDKVDKAISNPLIQEILKEKK